MTLSKHILRAAEFLRDLVARNVVRMQHLPGKIMVADLLTKAVARALFASLMDLIRQYAESAVRTEWHALLRDCLWPIIRPGGAISGHDLFMT